MQTRLFDSGGPTLGDWGEARLLGLLAGTPAATPGVEVGAGDDAAVVEAGGVRLAVSQDAMVEGVDFRRDWITPHALGARAFNIAVSDLAGMGAHPRWCTVTVCAAGATEVDDLRAIQAGFIAAAGAADCALVGGDLSDIDGPLVIDVCVLGVLDAAMLRRDTGRIGDVVAVTGSLGRAAAGLHCLQEDSGGVAREKWIAAQLQPKARIAEGLELVQRGVACGGDISDGLLVDAQRIGNASRCAVEIWLDRVPVDAEMKVEFSGWPDLALGGGEDFELILTVPEPAWKALQRQWPAGLEPLTAVGRLTEGTGVILRAHEGGARLPLPKVLSRHWHESGNP